MRRTLCIFLSCFFLLSGHVYADFESDVIDLVNAERAAQALHPLSYDHQLAAAARDHSEDMGVQGYFSHTSLDGRTVADRITDAGYSYNTYGENIAAGFSTPEDVITCHASTSEVLGLQSSNGSGLVSLYVVDPESDSIADRNGMPQNMIYGLLDFKIGVDTPGGSATVTIFLPEPAPEGYNWYKYSPVSGWHDYSDNCSFNSDRTRLTLTLTDGGAFDDDGERNGIIVDPSGLGLAPAATVSTDSGSGGGGSGGCFIDSLFGN